jgi:hypothetical protein
MFACEIGNGIMEDLFVKPGLKKTVVLLLYQKDIKV